MERLIKEVSTILNIEESVVRIVMKSFFKSFKNTVTKFRYRELDSLEGIKINTIIPGFGRLIMRESKRKQFNNKNKKHGEK